MITCPNAKVESPRGQQGRSPGAETALEEGNFFVEGGFRAYCVHLARQISSRAGLTVPPFFSENDVPVSIGEAGI